MATVTVPIKKSQPYGIFETYRCRYSTSVSGSSRNFTFYGPNTSTGTQATLYIFDISDYDSIKIYKPNNNYDLNITYFTYRKSTDILYNFLRPLFLASQNNGNSYSYNLNLSYARYYTVNESLKLKEDASEITLNHTGNRDSLLCVFIHNTSYLDYLNIEGTINAEVEKTLVEETVEVPVYEVESVEAVAENVTNLQTGGIFCLALIAGLLIAALFAIGIKKKYH